MRRDLITSALAVIVFTVLLGLAYPLVITGISQVAFKSKADGSLIKRDGRVVGSKLLAQPFKGARYFQPRPSQSGYSASSTFFSNRGPNQASALDFYRRQLAIYTAREHVPVSRVPVDAVTTSGSGVDPHISQANARIQANRVARVRGLPLGQVLGLVSKYTDGRFLGVLGEPGVNVTELNLALDGADR
jgi:potassium-transporting ATPase KdpC subunit